MKFKGIFFVASLALSTLASAADLLIWYGHEHSQLFHQQVESFAERESISIEVIDYYPSELKNALLSGDHASKSPDLIIIPSDFLGLHEQLGITPMPASWMQESADAESSAHRYGLPLTMGNHLMLFYNRQLIEQVPGDWDALIEQAQSLPDGVSPINWPETEPFWFIPFLTAFDGWPLQDGELTLDTEAMRQALAFYQQAVAQLPNLQTPCDQPCLEKGFIQGQWAFYIGGDWNLTAFEQAMGANLGVAVLPSLPTPDGPSIMKPFSGSYVLAQLAPSTEMAPVISRLAKLLQSESYQVAQFEQNNLLPATAEMRQRLVAHGVSAPIAGSLAQLDMTKPMPTETSMSIVWAAVGKGLIRLLDHDYTPEQAALFMQRIAERELR